MHRVLLAAAVLLIALPTAAAASAGDVGQVRADKKAPLNVLPPEDPLTPRVYLPLSQTLPPPHFRLNARQAVAISARTSEVRDAKRKHPALVGTAYISALRVPQGSFYHWDIFWRDGGKELVEVEVQPVTGEVLVVTTPPDIGWPLLFGFPGVLGGKLNAPYIWLPLCLLFLLPFFDPRRPFRLLHLDLVMLLLFGISHYFFAQGKPGLSVPLVYPFLLYAAGRALFAAFRPKRRDGPLMPLVSTKFLIAGVVVLMALRIVFGITESGTFDISTAGVVGADRIEHGLPLYQENDARGDTYGPVNYLLYVPAELVFPIKSPADIGDAARAATLAFDVLTLLGLFLLGRSLRAGPAGTRLGAGLAWAWAAFPYSALVVASNTNDALVPLFIVYALLLIRSPAGRGVVGAIGGMTKFAPLLVAPVLATARGPFRWRTAITVTFAYLIVSGGLVLLFLPDGGFREFWNTTLGWQLSRTSPLSIWTREPGIDFLKPVIAAAGVALAIAAAFVPRRRSIGQIAALCAAILAVSQLATGYWLYFYIVWFAPFLFIALFEEYRELGPLDSASQLSVTSSFVKPEMISQPDSVTATRSSIRTPSSPGR